MKRETLQKHMPMIQAYLAGWDLDYVYMIRQDGTKVWEATDDPTFEDNAEYRIREKKS